MVFKHYANLVLLCVLSLARVVAHRIDLNATTSSEAVFEYGVNSIYELDGFKNVSFEEPLAECVITSPTTGRPLKLGVILGEGVDGIVYKAQDVHGKYAAVKIFKSGHTNDKEFQNLQKLSKLRSKHIYNFEIGFETVQTCCDRPCLVMEIIHGHNMATILWKTLTGGGGALTYQLIRSILLQSLAAFNDTEFVGLCNDDQDLRNVMFEEATERVVFIDFGFAMPSRTCLPAVHFLSDDADDDLPSFRLLAYLLEDEGDKLAYLDLCDRITSLQYKSAKELLLREAFYTSPPLADSPGVFFGRHKDDVIILQLKALLDTGSPHIGRVLPDTSRERSNRGYTPSQSPLR